MAIASWTRRRTRPRRRPARLQSRLLLSHLALVALCLGGLGLWTGRRLQATTVDQAERHLHLQAILMADTLGDFLVHAHQGGGLDEAALADQAAEYAATTGIRVTVAEIDPTSTVSNNVVEYGVTLRLHGQPGSLRPGQTATVQIVTSRATNALYVPSAAVQTAGGQSTVTVLRGSSQVSVPVQLGVQGDQTTQIVRGLSQGERVVIPTTTGAGGFPGGSFPRIGGFGGGFGGGGGGTGAGGGGGG